jgi:UDP-N-acetylmuramoyl-tripeptide--D-alanyl-D-alanine ligase
MIRATLNQIASMIPGATVGEEWATTLIIGASKDTRSITPGNLYIPIIGDRYDGHDYAVEAIDRGGAAVLWQRDHGEAPIGVPFVAVADTLAALQQLASSYRDQLNVKVIGITGSNGKTSTKDMVSAVLAGAYRVHKTQGNLNNHIGLPMTLLELDARTEFAVLEMGMSDRGEIDLLTRIAKPDCAIITNIGDAHMLQLGSREGIAEAKFEITMGLKPGGVLIYYGDEPLLTALVHEAESDRAYEIISFGTSQNNDYYPEDIQVSLLATDFTIIRASDASRINLRIPMLGRHNAVNALAAAAVAQRFGIVYDQLYAGLAQMAPSSMRIEASRSKSGATLLNDAYNANPASMKAALELLKELTVSGRKLVVLGDMLELGPDAERYHREIGRSISPDEIHAVYTYGQLAAYIAEECQSRYETAQIASFTDKSALIERISRDVQSMDTILFKASRGMKLEEAVEALRQI